MWVLQQQVSGQWVEQARVDIWHAALEEAKRLLIAGPVQLTEMQVGRTFVLDTADDLGPYLVEFIG